MAGNKVKKQKEKFLKRKKEFPFQITLFGTEEMRKKHSERLKGHKMPQSAIEKLKRHSGENAIWYGRHHSEETKDATLYGYIAIGEQTGDIDKPANFTY